MIPFNFLTTLSLAILLTSCTGQSVNPSQKDLPNSPPVGGGCDGCELMYVGMPEIISAIDTSTGWSDAHRQLQVNGIVLKPDGISPASDIVIYYWHTNEDGIYADSHEMDARARQHGSLRGWVKSDANGKYTIYTSRPGSYPDGAEPEHIHFSVKEPGIANEYYIDDLVFADDPILKAKSVNKSYTNRGGSGIVEIYEVNGVQIANHKIHLGKNIPHYPGSTRKDKIQK